MVPAAQSMAPVISRMEPVGRSLTDNPKPRPKPQTQTASPRSTQSERPRISVPAPPISQTQVRPTTQPAAPPAQASPPLPDSRKYTVLLGAFGKQENAINLKNRLEAAGLPVSISEATENNKLWFRVMSGTFEDRNSAEAYSRELRQRKLVDRPYVRPM
jgi:cell division protein FtsN